MNHVRLHVCPIHKDGAHGALFGEEYFSTPAKRWEPRYDNGYPNVIYDPQDHLYRCYYTLFCHDRDSADTPLRERPGRRYVPSPERVTALGYAQSADGIHWEKPQLGLVEVEGSKANNLLFLYAHGTGVMLDEADPDPARRYKLVTKMDYGQSSHMAVNFSPDGLHWGEMIPWPEHNPVADSHNLPFRDPADGMYRLVTRQWRDGVRVAMMCESRDFHHWSEPREVYRGRGFEHQIYSMPVFPYEGLYLSFASVMHEGERSAPNFDMVDCELNWAVTPDVFDCVAPEEYVIPRGPGVYPDGAPDCGCIYASPPVRRDGKLWVYYMGGNGRHTDFRETSLMRGWLEEEKLACYRPREGAQTGELATTRLSLEGDELALLLEMEPGGTVQGELRRRWNSPALPGYSFEECRLERREDGWTALVFPRSLRELKEPVSLALRIQKASIYGVGGTLRM